MSLLNWLKARPWLVSLFHILGICAFVLAFFLPVFRIGSEGSFSFTGLRCTIDALQWTDWLLRPHLLFHSVSIPAATMIGLIDLLMALIVVPGYIKKFAVLRRTLAGAIIAGVAASWIFLGVAGMFPSVGYFVWIAAILMIFVADLATQKSGPSAEKKRLAAMAPMRNWLEAHPGFMGLCRIAGLCVFVTAFFLPACRMGGAGTGSYSGIQCALITIQGTVGFTIEVIPHLFSIATDTLFEAFVVNSIGLINPLIVLIFCLSFSSRFVLTRRILAGIVLLCTANAWMVIGHDHMVPLIGHYIWIAGILTILATSVSIHLTDRPDSDCVTDPPKSASQTGLQI